MHPLCLNCPQFQQGMGVAVHAVLEVFGRSRGGACFTGTTTGKAKGPPTEIGVVLLRLTIRPAVQARVWHTGGGVEPAPLHNARNQDHSSVHCSSVDFDTFVYPHQ